MFWDSWENAATASVENDFFVVLARIVGEHGERKAVLTIRLGVAGSSITASSTENGENVLHKTERSRVRSRMHYIGDGKGLISHRAGEGAFTRFNAVKLAAGIEM